jgi:hypothetical protein
MAGESDQGSEVTGMGAYDPCFTPRHTQPLLLWMKYISLPCCPLTTITIPRKEYVRMQQLRGGHQEARCAAFEIRCVLHVIDVQIEADF